ncbi:MAG: HAD family hydrolase [Halodesulfurarchaeum sp.]
MSVDTTGPELSTSRTGRVGSYWQEIRGRTDELTGYSAAPESPADSTIHTVVDGDVVIVVAYEAIVFDMDGVLLTGYHTDREIYRRAAQEATTDFAIDIDELPADLVDPDRGADIRRICDARGVNPDAFWGYREHASTAMENEQIAEGTREPFADTEVLFDLSDVARLGVVSNNRQGTVRFVLEHFGFVGHVDAFRGRLPTLDSFDRMKPDPAFLDTVLDALDVDPAETLFVGDRRSDVLTADRAGTDSALLVRDGDPPDGNPDPTVTIGTLTELRSFVQ